jgi:flagellar biosynthesis/type III secretory pathway protein FliH
MVVGAYLEEKLLKPLREKRRMEREQWIAQRQAEGLAQGLAQGRAEGRADNQKIWEAWNQRRLEASERGEPFDEPTPTTQEEP